jgi:hypothetical protein
VKSLGWSAVPLVERPPMELQSARPEQEALRELEDFIRHGNIEMEHTPEYIERRAAARRLYLNDLRSGRFSVQAHLRSSWPDSAGRALRSGRIHSGIRKGRLQLHPRYPRPRPPLPQAPFGVERKHPALDDLAADEPACHRIHVGAHLRWRRRRVYVLLRK